MTPAQIEAAVDATAALLELPLSDSHRPGVLQYFALAAQMADIVFAVPLTRGDESGAVFQPLDPRTGRDER
ncbi:MAG: DUF4089 domain-containing protein [Caldimonas sp.]